MSIIAVASENGMVAQHFGHCPAFMLFEVQEGRITGQTTVPNPGHKPGFLPVFLAEKGAETVIAGGMGGGAVQIFNEKAIEVITGATGQAEAAVARYLRGELRSSGSVCHEHQHQGECGNH